MQSEQLTNLHPGWVAGGWVVAAAVTAAAYLVMVGAGLVPGGSGAVLPVALALTVGFFTGGFLVGLRWMDAPVLHGVAITLVSVVAWFVGSVTVRPASELDRSATSVLGLVLIQLAAAVAGGWAGRQVSLGRGRPGD